MKTKEQAQLSLLSNEIILKGQLIKFKEVENEMNRIKHGLEFTQKEIEKNKEIINGLSVNGTQIFVSDLLKRIFNPKLEICADVWGEYDEDSPENSLMHIQIVKGFEHEDVMSYQTLEWYPTEKHLKQVLENMIVEEVIPDLIRKD